MIKPENANVGGRWKAKIACGDIRKTSARAYRYFRSAKISCENPLSTPDISIVVTTR